MRDERPTASTTPTSAGGSHRTRDGEPGREDRGATPVAPLSLRFLDPAIERDYRVEREARRSIRQTLISYAVIIMIWILTAVWGWRVLPGHGATVSVIVLGVAIPLLLLCVVLSVPRATRRLASRIEPWVDLMVGLCIVLMQALIPGQFDDHSRLCLAIFCMSVHAVMGLRFVSATLISLTLIASYLAVIAWVSPLSPSFVISSATWLLCTQLIAMRVSYIEERSRRRDFFRNRLLEAERYKSERLLLNVLPPSVAQRLKDRPGTIADGVGAVTVLFADLVGFTALSARLAPADVVALLNEVFSAFDEIADRHGLEKIKTIGDAYMVAAGLPDPREDHARAVAEMALEMLAVVARHDRLGKLEMRIGIHTGPVVAGVIGTKRYSYDLWGDTVNTASRMESHGLPGKIQIGEATYALLAAEYLHEPRGLVELKGKGVVPTWWLLGRRTHLTPAASQSRGDLIGDSMEAKAEAKP